MHFPTLPWVTSSLSLEMGFGGSTYTTEIGKCYRSELLHHHPRENKLLSFYQHTTDQNVNVLSAKTEKSRIALVKAEVPLPTKLCPKPGLENCHTRRLRFVPALNSPSLSNRPQRRLRAGERRTIKRFGVYSWTWLIKTWLGGQIGFDESGSNSGNCLMLQVPGLWWPLEQCRIRRFLKGRPEDEIALGEGVSPISSPCLTSPPQSS